MINLPGYKITEQIYSGRHSLIFRAERVADKLPVVVKTISVSNPEADYINRLHREFEIGKRFDDDNIISYYSAENLGTRLVLIIEDTGGGNLAEFIHNERPGVEDFLKIAVQLAAGLIAVHRKNIIHKDIKPSNIIFNKETGIVKIIDFGLASQLANDPQYSISPESLEGTLTYISPEQTGRMNRRTDYRTDFYSLGVTFYELLCGISPFTAKDPLELVHCHIAKKIVPVIEVRPEIPQAISDIVIKLLEKNPEDRYQSAYGLKIDLEECQRQLKTKGKIDNFKAGQNDISGKLLIDQKLYGREAEIRELLNAFEEVNSGKTKSILMLISGYSGIGKTSLVKEVHKPLSREKGYFISGKFDQFMRNVPYSSFVQAFQELTRIILTESGDKIDRWRKKILEALGTNGQVIIDVIPELEMITGPQPPVPELGATENQNRFNRLFQNFISVLSHKESPLVIFLDDLQWADLPTLYLIELIMTDPDCSYILFIGAYRDNEVDESHPLMKTFKSIESKRPLRNIVLKPLKFNHVHSLISESLKCSSEKSKTLSRVVNIKTRGNPFFINMFLTTLYSEKLIEFDFSKGEWRWNTKNIEAMAVTENVVDLLTGTIKKLPGETQKLLAIAAAIGNTFSLHIISVINETTEVLTSEILWEAIHAGMIVPLGENYKWVEHGFVTPILEKYSWLEQMIDDNNDITFRFLHDRVQQAADSLIHEKDKPSLHLRIGRLLYEHMESDELEENLFEIADHFNRGSSLISDPVEKEKLAGLNLDAARKAKLSSAYEPALNYSIAGLKYLTDDSWKTNYDLTLSLFLEKGENEYLNAKWDDSISTLDIALEKADTLVDRCKINEYKASLYRMKNELRKSLDTAVEALGELGMDLNAFPDESEVRENIENFLNLVKGRDIEDLYRLPELHDPLKLSAMALLWECFAPAYFLGSGLIAIIGTKMTEITIKEGNSPYSAVGYIFLSSITFANSLNDFNSAYKFGQLSLALNDQKYNRKENEACILDMWGTFVCHHKEPISNAKDHLLRGFYSGVENGSYQWAGYCAMIYITMCFWGPYSVGYVSDKIDKIIPGLKKIDPNMAQYGLAARATSYNLTHRVENPVILSDEVWPGGKEFLKASYEQNDLTTLLIDSTLRISLANWFSEEAKALEYALMADKCLEGVPGVFFNPVFRFHQSLAFSAAFENAKTELKTFYIGRIEKNLSKFEHYANNCPENYLHQALLIKAELKRIKGFVTDAMELYDAAIDSARESSFIQNEALSCEIAARFYLSMGRKRLANAYIREAYIAYKRWGATAKVNALKELYPDLLEVPSGFPAEVNVDISTTLKSGESDSTLLDFSSVMKSAQAISGEINLERLMSSMIKIIIESAGAQKGVLILKTGEKFKIEALADLEKDFVQVLQSQPFETASDFSVAIVRYVLRTGENAVIPDDFYGDLFTDDKYLMENKPGSVLCIPVLHKDRIIGTLYLENRLTTCAFSKKHIEVLRILLSQAVISMENARVYDRLEELVAKRTEELEITHSQLVDTAHRAGMAEVASNILHNVGNVLNSTNVTATLMKEELGRSKLSSFAKLVDLISENENNLGEFFTVNEKGKKLPDYMARLSDRLLEENKSLRENLGKLITNIEYIKEITRLQQHYVGGVQHEEYLSIADITDDAIQLYSSVIRLDGINIIRRYEEIPEVKLNRHKLMLILANLISNARDAVNLSNPVEKVIEVNIEKQGHKNVRIKVSDNGVGMDQGTIRKIFQHGFTDKNTGHGFGLHSSAIAASEMSANLNAMSDGPGRGAVFVLEIPLQKTRETQNGE